MVRDSSSGPRPPRRWGFEIILRNTTFVRTPLDEWSVRRRDFYMTTHNTHNRQTSMPPAGFETPVPASEQPQAHTLDRAATVISPLFIRRVWKIATVSFVMSVRPSVCPYGTTLLPLDAFSWTLNIFRRSLEKIQVSLKSDKNDGYFTWRPIYIFYHISLSS
jgi:hypothetical protein